VGRLPLTCGVNLSRLVQNGAPPPGTVPNRSLDRPGCETRSISNFDRFLTPPRPLRNTAHGSKFEGFQVCKPRLKKEPKSRPPAPQDPPQDPSRRSILGWVAKQPPQDCPQDPSRRSILGWVPKNGRRRVASRRLFWGGLQKMEGVGWPRDASKRHFRL